MRTQNQTQLLAVQNGVRFSYGTRYSRAISTLTVRQELHTAALGAVEVAVDAALHVRSARAFVRHAVRSADVAEMRANVAFYAVERIAAVSR